MNHPIMALSNFERMIRLADEVFAVRQDPDQLDVDDKVLERLAAIHPATVSEHDDGHGPVAWILLIPTTSELMDLFLRGEISERVLFERTQPGDRYDALYLCSAMVLEEYRRKGIARTLTLYAVERIRKDHSIQSLFVWTFSAEGEASARELARVTGLPLFFRKGYKD